MTIEIETRTWTAYERGRSFTYDHLRPAYSCTSDEYATARAECETKTAANETAARTVVVAQFNAEIAARAALPPTEYWADGKWFGLAPAPCPHPLVPTRIRSDDGVTVVVETGTLATGVVVGRKIDLQSKRVDKVGFLGDEMLELAIYAVDDDVFSPHEDSRDPRWCAIVTDPSAPKPVYEFLDRCPGGYVVVPQLAPGDVIVWGGRDKKDRKLGPYDRLVIDVSDTRITCVKCDYPAARKLRKRLA